MPLTLAMMYSLKLTRSPASPLMANSLWLSTGTSLSSSCGWGRCGKHGWQQAAAAAIAGQGAKGERRPHACTSSACPRGREQRRAIPHGMHLLSMWRRTDSTAARGRQLCAATVALAACRAHLLHRHDALHRAGVAAHHHKVLAANAAQEVLRASGRAGEPGIIQWHSQPTAGCSSAGPATTRAKSITMSWSARQTRGRPRLRRRRRRLCCCRRRLPAIWALQVCIHLGHGRSDRPGAQQAWRSSKRAAPSPFWPPCAPSPDPRLLQVGHSPVSNPWCPLARRRLPRCPVCRSARQLLRSVSSVNRWQLPAARWRACKLPRPVMPLSMGRCSPQGAPGASLPASSLLGARL